jgi:hypothetical protein
VSLLIHFFRIVPKEAQASGLSLQRVGAEHINTKYPSVFRDLHEMPHILDLPTELLIKIFTNLHVSDFGSCLLICRRLKAIIQDTCLLQYLIRTALAGVHDPLFQSGPPLTHRLESLTRWSDAWRQPGAYLRSPSRVLTRTSKSSTDFILCDDYLTALDFGGRHGHRHVAGYEWLDLRNPSDGWAKIQFEENMIPLAVAVALDGDQEDLLAILFG